MSMTMKEHMEMMTRIKRGQEPFPEKVKPQIKRAKNGTTTYTKQYKN